MKWRLPVCWYRLITPRTKFVGIPFEAYGNGWILAYVGSRYARMSTHAMRPHEWGARCMGGFFCVWATPPESEVI
jgi:hypothetical protein